MYLGGFFWQYHLLKNNKKMQVIISFDDGQGYAVVCSCMRFFVYEPKYASR